MRSGFKRRIQTLKLGQSATTKPGLLPPKWSIWWDLKGVIYYELLPEKKDSVKNSGTVVKCTNWMMASIIKAFLAAAPETQALTCLCLSLLESLKNNKKLFKSVRSETSLNAGLYLSSTGLRLFDVDRHIRLDRHEQGPGCNRLLPIWNTQRQSRILFIFLTLF